MPLLTVSELVVRYLERAGVSHIFGMPGAHILPVYDALRTSNVQTVLAKHEQGAAFMAGGYARAGRRVGACIATAGPGATNLVTGIANAYAERLPVLAITGETSTHIFGRGGLQESAGEGGAIDQRALFAPITRYARLVERTDYLGAVLHQTTQALFGREPGPVLLSIPFNVQKETVDAAALDQISWPSPAAPRRASPPADPASIADLAALIRAAKHPVVVAGYGCIAADARAPLSRLIEAAHIPFTTSLKAKGVLDEGSAWSLGCLGVTSDGDARAYLVEHADLVIFLGASFNERTSSVWDAQLLAGKQIAQIDANPCQLGRTFTPDAVVCGDLAAVLDTLATTLKDMPAKSTTALEQHRAHRVEPAPQPAATQRSFDLIRRFYQRLAQRFPAGCRVFDDNIVFAQTHYAVSAANAYFPNTGISSLGHALPAALGAQCHARAPTFAVLGDGGFQMCGMEAMTAINHGLPLNIVVLNNGTLSPIRKNQFQLYNERYVDCDFVNPDFKLLAAAFGVAHWRVEADADLDALFARADLSDGTNLIEIVLDKNAFPRYLSAR